MKEYYYQSTIEWTGNQGCGTNGYNSYERSYKILVANKPVIEGSSDPAFRGDILKHHPEDFLLASLSSCHMLWYLHFCSVNNVVVVEYTDHAQATMIEEQNGSGYFKEVVLSPLVIVKDARMIDTAIALHKKANEYCFIANSVNFPVKHKPFINVQ